MLRSSRTSSVRRPRRASAASSGETTVPSACAFIAQLAIKRPCRRGGAHHQVRMAADMLGQAHDRDVAAAFQRGKAERRGPGVVEQADARPSRARCGPARACRTLPSSGCRGFRAARRGCARRTGRRKPPRSSGSKKRGSTPKSAEQPAAPSPGSAHRRCRSSAPRRPGSSTASSTPAIAATPLG